MTCTGGDAPIALRDLDLTGQCEIAANHRLVATK
jgi:hypothetical protein